MVGYCRHSRSPKSLGFGVDQFGGFSGFNRLLKALAQSFVPCNRQNRELARGTHPFESAFHLVERDEDLIDATAMHFVFPSSSLATSQRPRRISLSSAYEHTRYLALMKTRPVVW